MKTCDFLVGITVFLGINLVITPPTVSIPRVNGATSKRRISDSRMATVSKKSSNCNNLEITFVTRVL